MNKKIFLSLLAIVMVFTITGCGKSDETKETKSKNKPMNVGIVRMILLRKKDI